MSDLEPIFGCDLNSYIITLPQENSPFCAVDLEVIGGSVPDITILKKGEIEFASKELDNYHLYSNKMLEQISSLATPSEEITKFIINIFLKFKTIISGPKHISIWALKDSTSEPTLWHTDGGEDSLKLTFSLKGNSTEFYRANTDEREGFFKYKAAFNEITNDLEKYKSQNFSHEVTLENLMPRIESLKSNATKLLPNQQQIFTQPIGHGVIMITENNHGAIHRIP
jgi:hypothetical protein